MSPKKKRILQLIIGAVLLAWLIWGIDFKQVAITLKNANPLFLIICFLLPFTNRILMPIKWNLLLKALNIKVSWFQAVKFYYISSFSGMFLPSTIGADAIRAYYISQNNQQLPGIISSIVVERLIGLIALLVFAIVGGFIFLTFFSTFDFDLYKFFFVSIASILILIGGFLFSFSDCFGYHFLRLADFFSDKKVVGKIAGFLKKFYNSFILFKNKKGTLFFFFLLTCLELSLKVIRTLIIALALNADIPVVYYFAFVPIILILIRLPISMNGFGLHEGGFVYFLSLVGIPASLAFSIGIVDHFILIYAVLPGGIFYALEKQLISLRAQSEPQSTERRM